MAKLTADFWVHAHIALLQGHHIPSYVIRRGDASSGAILVRLNYLDGTSQVFAQGYDPQGRTGWRALSEKQSDADIETILAQQISYDMDVWILEIEDHKGRHYLDPIIA